MVASYLNICSCLCPIHKLLSRHRNNNCLMLSLGINLHFKWNGLHFQINLLNILNINSLRKCWHWWYVFLGCPHWNCNNRNLQTLIMFRCHYKYDNTCRMRCFCCFYCLYNIRNCMYFLIHMLTILSTSWLRLRNRWSLLLGNNNYSCYKYNCCLKLISLQTQIMHGFLINIKFFMYKCNCRSQMRF